MQVLCQSAAISALSVYLPKLNKMAELLGRANFCCCWWWCSKQNLVKTQSNLCSASIKLTSRLSSIHDKQLILLEHSCGRHMQKFFFNPYFQEDELSSFYRRDLTQACVCVCVCVCVRERERERERERPSAPPPIWNSKQYCCPTKSVIRQ